MHHSYGVCGLRARVQLKTLSKSVGTLSSCQSPADLKRATDGPGDESDKDGGRKYGHSRRDNEKPFTESHKPEHLTLP